MKSNSLNKLMKLIINKTHIKSPIQPLLVLVLTTFSCVGLAQKFKIDKNTYFQLEEDVKQIMTCLLYTSDAADDVSTV